MTALGRGADEQLPLVLGVGEPRDADVLAVCEQVRDWMVEKMQEGPTRGWKSCTLIQDEVPRAVTNDLPEKYCVAITCLRTRRFNQIVYQFAHELLHVFVDPMVEHPLVEVFACLNSLAALRALAARWAASPSGGLRSYANKFTCYADAVVEAARKHYGFQGKDGEAVRAWARRLELDCNDRNAQILAASYLLPYCEELPAWTVIRLAHKAIQPPKCVEAQSWRASVSVSAWSKASQEVLTCDANTASAFILQVQDLFDLPSVTI